jgi:RNA polymerase sigma-70 factor (ECF subfamily)
VTSLTEWIEQAQAGDYIAFDNIYTELAPSVRRFISRLIGESSADDVLQDVFIALYKNLDAIDPPEKLKPYLFRVARHRCYDWLRRNGRYDELSLDDEPVHVRVSFLASSQNDVPPDETTHYLLLMMEVREAIDRLPDAQRQTLIFYAEEGLSYGEIAEIMDVNIGTVKSRLHHAKKGLRGFLRPETLLAIEDSMKE